MSHAGRWIGAGQKGEERGVTRKDGGGVTGKEGVTRREGLQGARVPGREGSQGRMRQREGSEEERWRRAHREK